MSKNHTGIDNYKKKVINFNERSNSSYDILLDGEFIQILLQSF